MQEHYPEKGPHRLGSTRLPSGQGTWEAEVRDQVVDSTWVVQRTEEAGETARLAATTRGQTEGGAGGGHSREGRRGLGSRLEVLDAPKYR